MGTLFIISSRNFAEIAAKNVLGTIKKYQTDNPRIKLFFKAGDNVMRRLLNGWHRRP